jgi:type IV pilus assembly protein PilC
MPAFQYEIINAEGDVQKGIFEAADPQSLADRFHKQGITVISIAPSNDKPGAEASSGGRSKKKVSRSSAKPSAKPEPKGKPEKGKPDEDLPWYKKELSMFGSGGVKLNNLLLFTSQLSSMVGAGLHLLNILSSLAKDTADKTLKRILAQVAGDVEEGESLSNALEKHPKAFSEIYVNLTKAAEATGNLDIVLAQLATYLEKTIGIRRKVKSAMTYPVVVLCIAAIAVMIILMKIVPEFERTYATLNAKLPGPTLMMIKVSQILREYFFLSMLGGGIFFFILYRLINTERGRYIFDGIIIKIPGFGPLLLKSVLTRFLSTLAILLQSGVNVLEALEIASRTAGNKVVEGAIMSSMEEIRNGMSINEALAMTNRFPEMVLRMISSGEEAGTLPTMLKSTADFYEQQVETAVEGLSSIIEPILMLFLGVVIGSVVVAVFLPIFNLGEAVKGSIHN